MTINLNLEYGQDYGALYFSAILTTVFYGVTCMQTFFYYSRYQNDPQSTKKFVAAIWVLDTIHLGLTIAGVYKYIVTGLENLSSPSTRLLPFTYIPAEINLELLFTGIVAVATQAFFIYRVYMFGGKKILLFFVWIIPALIQIVTAIIFIVRPMYCENGTCVLRLVIMLDHTSITAATFGLAAGTTIDIFISIFMTFLLLRKHHLIGFARTSHVLQRLILFAVITGTWTAIFATLTLILLHVFPTNQVYAIFGIPICSAYCNTVLGNLNARDYIRGEAVFYLSGENLQRSGSISHEDRRTTKQKSMDVMVVSV